MNSFHCNYYALTGPNRELILDPRHNYWHYQPRDELFVFAAQLWGYTVISPPALSSPPTQSDPPTCITSSQLRLVLRTNLLLTLTGLRLGDDLNRENLIEFTAKIVRPTSTIRPAALPLRSSLRKSLDSPHQPFAADSQIEVLYQPESRLGHIRTYSDPELKIHQTFNCTLSDAVDPYKELLPMHLWQHYRDS